MSKIDLSNFKVAIVHDWLIGGGAEKVVLELHHMFPEAPIYSSYATKEWRQKLDNKVITGYLGRRPFSKIRKFVPYLRAGWFSSLKLDDYDLVISSSGAEAKGIKTSAKTVHINYCHAPTHYYWSRYDDYLINPGFGRLDPLAKIGLKALVAPMRRWDYKAAQRPDFMIANSEHTKEQIKKYYGRDAIVVHPPVDIERFITKKTKRRSGFVIAARQTPYKRVDLAIMACTELGYPLKVIGNGPYHDKLISIAGSSIEFLTNVSDEDMVTHFQSAEGFIFPGTDDFGITPVEAMAAGTPVIAYMAGGALDYVIKGKTGLFFGSQTIASLANTLKDFVSLKWDSKLISKSSEAFSPENFQAEMSATIIKFMQEKK